MSTFESAVDAIVSGDIDKLARLLEEHPDLVHQRSTRKHRATLLHYVSANGVEDERQITPQNIVAIATLLLDAGADVNAESNSYDGHDMTLGLTATSIHPQRAGVQILLMALLIDRGAIIERTPGKAIRDCFANGRGEAAAYLALRGAHIDFEGAAGIGRLDLVKTMDATQQELERGYLWACQFGHLDMVEHLLDRGVDVATADDTRMTGLHWAVHEGHRDIVELLLARGAPMDAVNVYGGTILGQARWSSVYHPRPAHPAIIERLLAIASPP